MAEQSSRGRSLPENPASLVTEAHLKSFHKALLRWYDANKRDMPWRNTEDPYKIWVSEIMLQQTRVDQAEPYFRRFIEAFPTVDALAAADQDDVLKLWEGLGYYSRARNLHDAAQEVVRVHESKVPYRYDDIRELKGVGPYTAAAVLSIAHGEPHAVLDGNVIRVLARVFAINDDARSGRTRRLLQKLADALLFEKRPGDYNQALMELGATVCTPSNPSCTICPLQEICDARAAKLQESFPVKSSKAPIPHYEIAVAIILDDEQRVFIQQRPDDAMLGGLWEFPGGKQEADESLKQTCRREVYEELSVAVKDLRPFYSLKHAYSHFKITLHAFTCQIAEGTPSPPEATPARWVSIAQLDDFAFPRANRRLIEELQRRMDEPELFDLHADSPG